MTTVRLGFEVGTGLAVEIPIRHLAVTGQTQESGKTTTLEALIARSGRRALAFRTKRAEGAFASSTPVAPYFRERADWQFVAAILEATLRERLKFQRPWIMKVCRGTQTLADVQRAVRRELLTAKGLSESVYTELDAYLDIVVPQLARLPFVAGVTLRPGINVMDLTDYSTEVQALVIRSALEWIYERERETIAIIPEAWEFLPQTRSSPVLLAAEQLIRKGAAAQNYLWLDSQDIAGVHKTILRSVAVWVLGVQREANEIKRTLAHVHGADKPKVTDIAHLGRGQFVACFGHQVRTVYVQPTWLSETQAAAIARGDVVDVPSEEIPVNAAEAQALRDDNARLARENESLRRRLGDLERTAAAAGHQPAAAAAVRQDPHRYSAQETFDNEALYQAVKTRLMQEAPAILAVLAEKPELRVTVQRRTVEASGDTLRGRIAMLIAAGFFEQARAGTAIETELRRQAFACSRPNCYREADKLASEGFLTKEDGGYVAVASMKVNIVQA